MGKSKLQPHKYRPLKRRLIIPLNLPKPVPLIQRPRTLHVRQRIKPHPFVMARRSGMLNEDTVSLHFAMEFVLDQQLHSMQRSFWGEVDVVRPRSPHVPSRNDHCKHK